MAELKISEKKEWAKILYTKEHLTQKEISERVGISRQTMTKWVTSEGWDKLKQSLLITRDAQLNMLYMQMDEMNTAIMKRPEGERFPSSKEADAISKLATAIKTMESEASISDIVEVGKRMLHWLRPISPDKARDMADVINEFIQHVMKK